MRSHIVMFALFAVLAGLLSQSLSAAGNQGTDESRARVVSILVPADPDTYPLYSSVVASVETVTNSLPDYETTVSVYTGEDPDALAEAARAEGVELVVAAGSPLNAPAAQAASQYPEVAFLMIDGAIPDAENAANLLINRREQAYLAGFIAGMRLSDLLEDDEPGRAGLLFGSGLLMGENVVQPAYRLGVRAARTHNDIMVRRHGRDISEDELERSFAALQRENVPVIVPFHYHNVSKIAGAAGERGFDIIRLDNPDPDTASNQTLAAIAVDIEETVSQMVRDILEDGPQEVGTVRADFRSGALFLEDDFSRFEDALSESSREAIAHMSERLASGELTLPFEGIYVPVD
ncbi:MAG: BMP family ABC transporter substrate-binding protein [Spirochaetia bacterium]